MDVLGKFKGLNSVNFYKRFGDDDSCLEHVSLIKWKAGYSCKKCGNGNYCAGKSKYSKRCTRCKHDESVTAGTMFDKVKFPILTCFHIIFKICTKIKGMSALEISKEFETRVMTCWKFKWKVQQAMKSSRLNPLKGEVHIDEFYIGGPEEGNLGRSHGKKRLVVLALEIIDGKNMGRAYAKLIEEATTDEILSFMEDHVDKKARVVADKWASYISIKNLYPLLEQKKSEKGKGFKELHIHIMNIQGWLRGIHHHCSKEHLQGYLDEYHFRFNRRNSMATIFNVLIERMMQAPPTRLKNNQKSSAI